MSGQGERSRSWRVGLLVAIAMATLMAGTFLIGRERRFWERKVDYEVRFTRTNGLRVGSPVSLTGVDIGSVQDIAFPEDSNANYILVRVSIAGTAAPHIRENTVARIRTIGLLGDKFIELSGGSPDRPLLSPGSILSSVDPIDYEALLGESGDIVTNIVEASNSLKNVFAAIDRGEGLLGQMLKNREQGAATLDRFRETMTHLEATTAAVEQLVKDVQSGKGALGVLLKRSQETEHLLAKLDRSADSLAAVTARLERAHGALPRLVEDEEYGKHLLKDLRATLQNLAELTQKANQGQGTLGRLINDPSLYRDAKDFVTSTRSSWAFSVYRGLRGLFPPYGPPPVAASSTEAAPSSTQTPELRAPSPAPSD